MSTRHLTATRALLASTLLSALVSPPASAAMLAAFSIGNERYLCATNTHKRDGTSVESPARQVSGAFAGYFELGTLPATPDGDSPEFESLALRCWIPNEITLSMQPQHGEASYSIVLHRDDPFWIPDPLIAVGFGPMLPREGWVVNWLLSTDASADPPRHIEILQAWTIPCVNLSNPLPIPYLLTQGPYRLTHDGARVPS